MIEIHSLSRRVTTGIVAAVAIAGTVGLAACSSSDGATAGLPEVTFTATEYAFEGPESVPAGPTKFVLVNNGTWPHQIQLAKLEEGKTLDDIVAFLASGEEGIPAWATMYGGPNGVEPGASLGTVVDLAEGSYAMMDFIPGADGVPQVAQGMLRPLAVTAPTGDAASEPAADLTVTGADFVFDLAAEVTPGEHTIRFENKGETEHEIVVVRLAGDATVEEYSAAFGPDAPGGPPPGNMIGGTTIIEPGMHNSFTAEFEPGRYALVCFVPDGDVPHFALGMAHEFEVK